MQVRRAPGPLAILSSNLDELLALADPEAAESLNAWMGALKRVEEVYEVSYGQRLVIIRNFEERGLWRYLTDPDTDQVFPNLTAWLSSGFIGCRRVNMEAHKDARALADIPPEKLIDVPKSNIHTLTQLSTAVRNDPGILAAARNLSQDDFLEKVEKEQPNQHLEVRRPLRFNPGRSGAKIVEEVITYALEHNIAGSRDEALVRMAETAKNQWDLEDELRSMPAETTENAVQ
jgi:hypothetical protein